MRRRSLLAGLLLAPLAVACSGGEAADVAADDGPKELVVFVYDRSTSLPNHALTLARDLTNQRIQGLDHGDRIAAVHLLQLSLAEPAQRWSQQVPERQYTAAAIRQDSVSRARFLRDAQDYLIAYSDTAGRDDINGTDLLSTMHDLAEELRPYADHRATAYLFSDMLQSTPEIEMERLARMPARDWVNRNAAEGKLPDLSGLCVVVVGARVDTEAGQRVKAFWKEYFEATGATLLDENYMLRPVRLPERPCRDAR